MLPFRELAKKYPEIVEISTIDLQEENFPIFDGSLLVIGIFCAMSNVTGFGPSIDRMYYINEKIHAAGGIVCWDLASFISHKNFDMNPPNRQMAYTDFAFVSPHKLIGGPGTTGILIGRHEWMKNSVPTIPGGGSVFFASKSHHSYIQNTQEREEAGTPDIIGCIRTGLVFSFHSKLGNMELLHAREISMAKRVRSIISGNPRIHILGGLNDSDITTTTTTRTTISSCILSLNISFGDSEKFLHYNFIVAVLNDFFGIQARGGCACAGPYAQELLGLSESVVDRFDACLQQSGQEIFRPGFVRIGLHWTMTEEEVEVIGNAISWIANHGWKILSVYKVDIETGEWKHRIANHDAERDWISDLKFWGPIEDLNVDMCRIIPIEGLIEAANDALGRIHENVPLGSVRNVLTNPQFDDLVWFAMPNDSKIAIESQSISGDMNARILHPSKLVDLPVTAPVAEVVVHAEPVAKRMKKFQVPRKLRVLATQAILDYNMIKEGDRVMIGISGGKDSLSLLHILLECQKKCPFRFEIAAATVDPQVPEYQPHALKDYMASLGVAYHYLSQPIVEIAKTAMTGKQSICAFCSRMKRGMLYRCMRENGYNVLALGQHLDDLVESFLMSCFRNGAMRTMKANYFVKEKDLRVIRPLVYVREKMTAEFADEAKLPIIRDNCPACFAAPKERHRIKVLLSHEEFQNPHLFASMLQSMKPIIGISSAMSTKELIEGRMFPFGNMDDEDEDQGAEESLLPCSDGSCPLPPK